MDYKEKYQNALERAKKGLPIDEVFPELKESEDERIRKELISFVNKYYGEETKKEVLAYLERQKKQTIKIDACGFPIRVQGESACSYLARCLAPDMRNIWYEACAEIKEKQKEQKPAEWSEEDEQFLLVCKNALQKYQSSDKWDAVIIYNWLEKRLKSLRPQSHWKPSEEQMDALEYFIRSWGESGTMSPQNPTLCAAKSLLSDLQKLL